MERIERLDEQVKSFDKLTITEAKELYMKAINASDEKQKKEYIDKIILGTIYVVFNYIENNNLEVLESSQYDINDIQNAFIELWIKKIKDGALLKYNSFSNIINYNFLSTVYTSLGINEMSVNENLHFTHNNFVDLFSKYIELKNKDQDIKIIFNEFLKSINCYYTYKDAADLFMLFESIYNNLNFDKDENLDMAKTKISAFVRIIINNGLCSELSDSILKDDISDVVVSNILYDNFMNDIDNASLTERERNVIFQRFGLNGEQPRTLDDVGKDLGVQGERIRQIEAKAIRKLKRSPELEKYQYI